MDYETAARYSARREFTRLRQEAAQRQRCVVADVIGVEVTMFPDGSALPELDRVIFVHMARRALRKAAVQR